MFQFKHFHDDGTELSGIIWSAQKYSEKMSHFKIKFQFQNSNDIGQKRMCCKGVFKTCRYVKTY